MSESIEHLVVNTLVFSIDYTRKVLPHLRAEYFEDPNNKIIFEELNKYFVSYDNLPTKEALSIEVEGRKDLTGTSFTDIQVLLNNMNEEPHESEWLVDTTEKWCRDRAIYIALLESIQIADGGDDKQTRDAIPSILSNALSVSFDNSVGHDYFDNADDRFAFYHKREDKIPFDLEFFNRITKGGLPSKTLNVALAGTGVGKSLFMCHCAASNLTIGKNVLYITMEMAEEKIAERIDANLLNVDCRQLDKLPKVMFDSKVEKVKNKTTGRLIVKEYPTASAHVGHFKSLLQELAIKKSFIPDIIYIDYLNICASARYKGAIVNSYTYVKAIAEELRGLAVEADVPIVSATQTTRSGFGSSDVDLTDTSESFGLPATADLMFALISTEELEEMNQIMVKQLKNRYNDPTMNKRFTLGLDRNKMRLYDCKEQGTLVDSNQTDDQDDVVALPDMTTKFTDFKV
jgi:archaellum biogenesis ATPase FlaH|tara:strand:+ start:1094 stop:2470 length:1377 start_codon:yes stop_codon:yes gene_type:complete